MLRIISLFFVLVIAACGSIPGPFEGAGSYTKPEILEPQDSFGIYVDLPEKMPQDQGEELVEEVALALQGMNIPASSTVEGFGSYRLKSRVRPRTRRMGEGVVDRVFWYLYKNDGELVGKFGSHILATDPSFKRASEDVAAEIALLIQDPDSSIQEAEPDVLKIFLAPVTGAPGNGNVALTAALLSELRARGAFVTRKLENADVVVQCKIVVSRPVDGKQKIKIIWIVGEDRASEMGRITQRNTIVAGSLDGKWGATARAVAMGGVDGIAQILQENTE